MLSMKYADVQQLLDKAWAEGALVLECPTAAKATVLVHRMNRYRRDVRKDNPNTALESWMFRRVENVVFIERRQVLDEIKVFRKDGTAISKDEIIHGDEEKESLEKFEALKKRLGFDPTDMLKPPPPEMNPETAFDNLGDENE